MVYQKLTRLLAPRIGLYFGVMLAFAGVTALLGETQAAVAELIVVGVLLIACGASALRRKQEADRYLKELMDSMDQATRDSTLNCPLPLVMFRPDTDEVVWSNDHFLRLTGDQERMFDTKMSDLAPNFDSRWLLEGKSECPEEVELGHRRYQVFGDMARPAAGKEEGLLATTYWLDVTDLADTRDIFKATRPVLALLLLDNYEDAIKGQDENIRSAMLSEISQRFSRWAERTSGVFCRLDRDRFLFLFEEQYLTEYKEEKFSLLDSVREVVNPAGIPATLSIGVGVDGDTFEELYRFANLSVEMALSRGGDQAVVKNRFTFEFFGGRSKETERRTKVKSRVMASAMGELVADASCVMVMGHRTPDFDAVGAAVGVCAIARMKGVPHYIIREAVDTPADGLYDRVARMPQYEGVLLDSQEAMLRADSRSLLVVVDTNRPEQVQNRELLDSCNKVAVIDQMLDTKNFTMRTGGRTFEAAAMLRRAGGDTGEVRKLFQTGLDDAVAKYGLIQNAKMYRRDIAIAASPRAVGRVTAAQAADELLNIAGVGASFVLYPEEGRVVVSARSLSETNVQVILEALGGGGNAGAAGAQVPGKTVEQVLEELHGALDRYFDDKSAQPL
ncbi:MAG: DHH family phosphoesterase [Oscillospiraceae bacterium]|nr:DHH family phosphoesterase [Oscillospiraceae bacterium]